MACETSGSSRTFLLASLFDDTRMTAPTSTDADTPTPPASRKNRRGRLLVGVLALLLIPVMALVWAVGADSGTRNAWRAAVWLMQGKLSGTYAGGNLAEGLSLRDLRYRNAAMQLDIDRIDARWRLSLTQRRLSVAWLHAGTVTIDRQAAAPAPAHMPASLSLPLSLNLRDITLQKLTLRQGASVTVFSDLQLHASSDGVRHTLTLNKLTTAAGQVAALLRLDGQQPFAINGSVELASSYQQEKFRLTAQLSGSLEELGIALTAGGDKLNGSADAVITPFAGTPLRSARIDLRGLDPQAFDSAAPKADLRLQADFAPATADQSRITGKVKISNALPGSLDQRRLPLISARASIDLGVDSQQLADLHIALSNKAGITGTGQFRPQDKLGSLSLQIARLDLQTLHQELKPTALHGPLTVQWQPDAQHIALTLQDARHRLQADATLSAGRLTLHQAQWRTAQAGIDLAGSLAITGVRDYAVQGRLRNVDPALWLHTGAGRVKPARINLDFDSSGALSPERQIRLGFTIRDSSYDNLPMRGNGKLHIEGERLLPGSIDLLVAGNRLHIEGAFGATSDQLDIHVDAPQLERLGFGISGLLKFDGRLTGTLQRPSLRAAYSGKRWSFGAHRLEQFSGQADVQTDLADNPALAGDRLQLSLDGTGYSGPDATLERIGIQLSGNHGNHRLAAQADGRIRNQTLALRFSAHGGINHDQTGYGWNGVIDRLENQGLPRIALAAPLNLNLAAGKLIAGATRLDIDHMVIDLKKLHYRQGRLYSEGSARAIDVRRIMELVQEMTGRPPPLDTDLVLDADWNFSIAETAGGFLHIARRRGDVAVGAGSSPAALGLSALQLRVDLKGQAARFDGHLAASRIGMAETSGHIGLLRQNGILTLAAASPLKAQARLRVSDLDSIGALLGPQYRLNGRLALEFNAAGTLAGPRLSGAIDGDELAVTWFDQGMQLKDGVARIVMDDNVIDLRQLEFHGGDGILRASGKVQLGDADPDLDATLIADRLQLFASPDRQLMLSGQARLANIHERLRIDGSFVVDQALFDLPKSSAPALGDDVVIMRKDGRDHAGATAPAKLTAAGAKPVGRFAPVMNIQVNLGNRFHFHGGGADLRLRGDMTVHGEPLQPLRATGAIHVAAGSYEAFGAKLNIERGIINFQGPISNPGLNILAMRRHQDIEAGVEVSGNASRPRVRLVSEPNVPDDEKLSWMMFGHGSDSSGLGQHSASSQALAFVGNFGGKKIARDIGLDQFFIGASESGLSDAQVVHLGKAISEKLSVGYEQSLTGAASIAKATWQLSRRWSMVARTGAIDGLNMLYNRRFD